MKCIFCSKADTRVIETREKGNDIRRRRECPSCQERFTTYERVDLQPMRVIKRDGTRELYDRQKLKRGMLLACEKRPVTDKQIERALNEIEQRLRKQTSSEIPSSMIGDLTMDHLRRLDEVAYIRFASVYKQFQDITGFTQEISVLKEATK